MRPEAAFKDECQIAVTRATDHLLRQYRSTAAIIFYGACRRERTGDGLLDFYVLVDSCRSALGTAAAFWARLLPPNVYYHEAGDVEPWRAKVAVMDVTQFLSALGPERFTSTLSARFAQPSVIVFARDDALRARLAAGFLTAAETTVARTLPLLPARFTARELWQRAFIESFAAELRPESGARIASLVDAELSFYCALTRKILGEPAAGMFHHDTPAPDQAVARTAWRWRRIAGKSLNAARLIKAAFTFKGGLDYVTGKIRRHAKT